MRANKTLKTELRYSRLKKIIFMNKEIHENKKLSNLNPLRENNAAKTNS